MSPDQRDKAITALDHALACRFAAQNAAAALDAALVRASEADLRYAEALKALRDMHANLLNAQAEIRSETHAAV